MTNECGNTVSQTITLTHGTPAKPVVTAAGALTFCKGGVVILSAPASFSNYIWSTGALTRQITVTESGNYSVVVSNGCPSPASDALTVTVHELPLPAQITVSGAVTFCEGQSVVLSVPAGFNGYTWSNGKTSREIAVSQSGSYSVKVNDGCESAASGAVTVTVKPLPSPVSITASGPVSLCEGQTVLLSAPTGFAGYRWSTGETSRQINVNQAGDYSVKVNDGCESVPSAAKSVTVNSLPASPTNIVVSGNTLTANGSTGSYVWLLNDEVLTELTSQLEAVVSGNYKAYGVSKEGCRSTNFASVSFVVTAVEQAEKDLVSVYPNPGQRILFIEVNNVLYGQAELSMFNTTGRLMFREAINFQREPSTIQLNALPAGLYDLMIRRGNQVILKKIVVF